MMVIGQPEQKISFRIKLPLFFCLKAHAIISNAPIIYHPLRGSIRYKKTSIETK